jgi:hypothetical protein
MSAHEKKRGLKKAGFDLFANVRRFRYAHARAGLIFHGRFYGLPIFCCKTALFGETPRK